MYVLPQFQNKFVTVALFQALMIFGGLIYPQHRILTSYIEKMENKREELTAPISGEVSANSITAQSEQANFLEDQIREVTLLRNSTTLYSTAFILVACVIFGFYCSHRLGGPIFKTIRYLRDYREGQKLPALTFRDGDFFHELADEVSQTLQTKEK